MKVRYLAADQHLVGLTRRHVSVFLQPPVQIESHFIGTAGAGQEAAQRFQRSLICIGCAPLERGQSQKAHMRSAQFRGHSKIVVMGVATAAQRIECRFLGFGTRGELLGLGEPG